MGSEHFAPRVEALGFELPPALSEGGVYSEVVSQRFLPALIGFPLVCPM